MNAASYRLKGRGTVQLVFDVQLKLQRIASLMLCGIISAYETSILQIWKGSVNVERNLQVLKQHVLPSR